MREIIELLYFVVLFPENTANDEITNLIKGYVQEIEELR